MEIVETIKKTDDLSQVLGRQGPSRYIIGEQQWGCILPGITIPPEKCPRIFNSMRLTQFFERGYYLLPLIRKNLYEMNQIGSLNLFRETSQFQYEAEHLLSVLSRGEYVLFGSTPISESLGIRMGEIPNFLLNALIRMVPELMATPIVQKWRTEVHSIQKEITRAEEEKKFDDALRMINELGVVKTLLPNVAEVAGLVTLANKINDDHLFFNKSVITRDRYSPTHQATIGFYDLESISVIKQDMRDRLQTTGIVLTIPIKILFDIKI